MKQVSINNLRLIELLYSSGVSIERLGSIFKVSKFTIRKCLYILKKEILSKG